MLKRLKSWLHAPGPRLEAFAGFLEYAARSFYRHRCTQSAAALAYTSLLAMVPFVTILALVLRGFNVVDPAVLEGMATRYLVPGIGDKVEEFLSTFTANAAGQLTGFGVVGLAISSLLLLATIERSFNSIWRVERPRPFVARLLNFWATLTLLPICAAVAVSTSAQVLTRLAAMANPPLDLDLGFVSHVIPYFMESVAFCLLYIFIPNRRTLWRDALVGGLVAAALLELSKRGFVVYLRSFPVNQTIYGALSTVPLFLIWLYVAWSTALIGAVVAAALPEYRAGMMRRRLDQVSVVSRLVLALTLLRDLNLVHRRGKSVGEQTLFEHAGAGIEAVRDVLRELAAARWVVQTGEGDWILARDMDEVTLHDLAAAMRLVLPADIREAPGGDQPWLAPVAEILDRLRAGQAEVLRVPLKPLLSGGAAEA